MQDATATYIDPTAKCAGSVEHPVRLQAGAELHNGASLGRLGFLNVGTVVYGNVEIGRYFSCGRGAEIGVAPHPLHGLSTHGFTVDSAWFPRLADYGRSTVRQPPVAPKPPTRIGHDVWVGAQAIVMPGVTIGTGAVVAANAVVTKDVAPYEIVGGVPARHLAFRFSEALRARLLASEWWTLDHSIVQELPYRDAEAALAQIETPRGAECDQAIARDAETPPTPSVGQTATQGSAFTAYQAAPFLSLKHSTYFPVYDELLGRYAGKAPVLVEVGVLNGGSLFMWREMLGRSARIIGVDLNPEAVWLRDEGFEIHIGDQSDPAFWDAFFGEVGSVDIVLDDGGHTYAQQIVTAESSLDRIRDGGLLIVEDTHTSYMESFGGPSDRSFVSWAVDAVHGLNRRFSAFASEHHPTERRAWSITFYESIVAFHVHREFAAIESRQTTNGGVSRDAKDFRYHQAAALSDDELETYFRHRGD